MHQTDPPDFYLVLSGPPPSGAFVKGGVRPWLITHVYLFDAPILHAALTKSGVKIGLASSVQKAQWNAAEIYPTPNNQLLVLSNEQQEMLALFS